MDVYLFIKVIWVEFVVSNCFFSEHIRCHTLNVFAKVNRKYMSVWLEVFSKVSIKYSLGDNLVNQVNPVFQLLVLLNLRFLGLFTSCNHVYTLSWFIECTDRCQGNNCQRSCFCYWLDCLVKQTGEYDISTLAIKCHNFPCNLVAAPVTAFPWLGCDHAVIRLYMFFSCDNALTSRYLSRWRYALESFA